MPQKTTRRPGDSTSGTGPSLTRAFSPNVVLRTRLEHHAAISKREPWIYCIGAPSSERRRSMERRLAHHGLLGTTRFVDAVQGGTGADAESTKRLLGQACFVSHLRAMEAMLEAGDAAAIIAEDDVLLHNEWRERLDGVLANL